MIGSSEGKQYDTELGVALGRPVEASEKPAGASKSSGATKVASSNTSTPENDIAPIIDREHQVPLVASALTDDSGQMYGMAIDHRIPAKPEYEKHLWNHEAYENDYMNDLVKNGMSSQDAYHKAHDWSTARESAAVTAEFGEKGLEDYKQHWRDASSVAAEPSEMPRHPDAHTTKHGLDESELGRSFPNREAIFRGLKGAGINATDTQFEPLNPMSPHYQNPGGHAREGVGTWFRGADNKWRQEIPDVGSKIKPGARTPDYLNIKPGHTLNDVLDHPELFKSYPGLKSVKVERLPAESPSKGATDGISTIWLRNGMSEDVARSTLLHEIQHMIQNREGFSLGASPERMAPYIARALRNSGQEMGTLDRPSEDDIGRAVFDAYHHVAGEVESRNVQTRMDWPLKALDILPPSLTEDVPRNRQLNAPK